MIAIPELMHTYGNMRESVQNWHCEEERELVCAREKSCVCVYGVTK